MHSRRVLLLAALAGFLMMFTAAPARAAGDQDARAFVERLAKSALDMMANKGLSEQERANQFRQLFTSSVDLPEIGRFVLGRHWNAPTTPEQRTEFLRLFEDMVVLTWAGRFKDYGSNVVHQVTGIAPDGERGYFVESVVNREKQEPIDLRWRLRQADGALKVIDLIVEGSDMAITYRSEYASVLRNNGGRVEGLLAAMQKKVAELRTQPGAVTAGNPTKAN
ncbi:MAG: ABC transporter substrate-binding protein [Magnetospirillum sp.]|nr:ABC transporter substrate-binding protein [Magnetospirillum sp.]